MSDTRRIIPAVSIVKTKLLQRMRRYDTEQCKALVEYYCGAVNAGRYEAAAEARKRLEAVGLTIMMTAPKEGGAS
jgi:hypothetical protein